MAGLPSIKLSSGQSMPQLGLGYVFYIYYRYSFISSLRIEKLNDDHCL